MPLPEQRARETIDQLLRDAGWTIQDRDQLNLRVAQGVAVREFPLQTGYADYLLFVDRKAIGAMEAKASLQRYQASVLKPACDGQLVPQDPSDEPAA